MVAMNKVLTNLKFQGSTLVFDDVTQFPETPMIGQMCFTQGVLWIYADVGGIKTWFPLSNKSSQHIHTQAISSSRWIVEHSLRTEDIIFMIYDDKGIIQLAGDVTIIDQNNITIEFTENIKGKVVIFGASEAFAPAVKTNRVDVGDISLTGTQVIVGGVDIVQLLNNTAGNLNAMFNWDPSNNNIIFKGNLIPANTEALSIGSEEKKIKDLFVSANTIHLGNNTKIEGTAITVDAGKNPKSVTDTPTLVASNITAKPFAYDPGIGEIWVRPIIQFQDKSGNNYPISFDTDNYKFSFDALGNHGQGTIVCKIVEAESLSLSSNLDVEGDTTIDNNLRVDGKTTLGYDESSQVIIRGTVDLKTPIIFGEDATLGDGNDTIVINAGSNDTFEVTSKFFTVDKLGNVSIGGTLTANNEVIIATVQRAQRLETARTISLSGEATGSVSFDGSEDANINVTIGDSHAHAIDSVTGLTPLLGGKESKSSKGQPNGYAGLNEEGTVPLEQLPANVKESKVVDNIASRDAIVDFFEGLRCHVIDATADVTVTTASAGYIYNGASWIKQYEGESMDFVVQWVDVQNKPVEYNPSAHTHDPADLTGPANFANYLTTPRVISLTGDATGEVTFNGGADVAFDVAIANDSHTHDTQYFKQAEVTSKLSAKADVHTHPYLGESETAVAASKLATGRTITLTGDVAGSILFDGTLDKTMTVTVGDDSHTHDARYYTEDEMDIKLAAKSASTHTHPYLDEGATAVAATKLATSRTIALTGDVTGSVAFDGTDNASITTVVGNDSHTHDTRYLRRNASSTPTANNVYDLGSAALKFKNIHATTFTGTAVEANYADLAEKYMCDNADLPIGTVICASSDVTKCDHQVKECTKELAYNVIGVIADKPAFVMNNAIGNPITTETGEEIDTFEKDRIIMSNDYPDTDNSPNPNVVIVTLTGMTPVRIKGTIRKGEPIVSVGDGCAREMKDESELLYKIGVAFESFENNPIDSEVLVMCSIK